VFLVITLGEGQYLMNSKIICKVLMNRMGEKIPPEHINVLAEIITWALKFASNSPDFLFI